VSGSIDPLLPQDEDAVARASPVDLTALFQLHRTRLVRIAAAITLDRVLADEVVEASFASLQKHIGTVGDPVQWLLRSVVTVAASRRGAGRSLPARGRRKVVTRRHDAVMPHFARHDQPATWVAFASLSRQQRAVLVLTEWQQIDLDDVAELLGCSRHAAASARDRALATIARANVGADPPEQRVGALLAAAMPQLADGADVPIDVEPDPTPTGRRSLRLFVPSEPKRHRLAWTAVGLALVGAMVMTVAFFSHRQGDLLPSSADTTPTQGGIIQPGWYAALRPLVPERFDRLALVALDADRIGYLAIDTETGRSLEIRIVRKTAQPGAATSIAATSVTELPGGFRMVRDDGTAVEVSCSPCSANTDGAPADGVDSTASTIEGSGLTMSAQPNGTGADGSSNSTTGAATETPTDETPTDQTAPNQTAPGQTATDETSGLTSDETTPDSQAEPDLRAITATVAEGFPIEEVDSSFGVPSAMHTNLGSVVDAVVAAVPDVRMSVPVATSVSTSAAAPVQSISTSDASLSVLVVHGVFPPPPDVVRPPVSTYDGVIAGWVIDAAGTATRVVAPRAADPRTVSSVETLLDALGEIPATG